MIIKYPNLSGASGFVTAKDFEQQFFDQYFHGVDYEDQTNYGIISAITNAFTGAMLCRVQTSCMTGKSGQADVNSDLTEFLEWLERAKVRHYPKQDNFNELPSEFQKSVNILRGDEDGVSRLLTGYRLPTFSAEEVSRISSQIFDHIKTATLDGMLTKPERANKRFAENYPSRRGDENSGGNEGFGTEENSFAKRVRFSEPNNSQHEL